MSEFVHSDPSFLIGSWAIDRTLANRASGDHGTFTGVLNVTVEGDHLLWLETGRLSWAGRELPASRTLAVRRVEGEWWVTFSDGSLFHRWVVGTEVIHPCADDTYCGLIERYGPDQLTISWDVTGPTEDQLIVSRLTRRS